jgi:hypothetical protein
MNLAPDASGQIACPQTLTSIDERCSRDADLMLYPAEKVDAMPKSIRIVPETEQGKGQAVNFVLAIGSVRQMCRLQTTFRTKNEAFNYFYKRRTEFERVARARHACGDIENGVIELAML